MLLMQPQVQCFACMSSMLLRAANKVCMAPSALAAVVVCCRFDSCQLYSCGLPRGCIALHSRQVSDGRHRSNTGCDMAHQLKSVSKQLAVLLYGLLTHSLALLDFCVEESVQRLLELVETIVQCKELQDELLLLVFGE